jgi:2-oxoglutarate ferredoxin oxidoreductase subunit delta
VAQESQWEIAINSSWCKKCGLCIAFCPRKVLKDSGGPKVVNPALCAGCLMCEMHCPDFAITVRRREENGGPEASARE